MSSDRLKELQRQCALAQEQVAWFDREIAKEMNASPAPVQPAQSMPHLGIKAPETADVDTDADRIIEKYRDQGRSIRSEFWRGCAIYLVAAVVLGLLGIGAIRVLNRLFERFF